MIKNGDTDKGCRGRVLGSLWAMLILGIVDHPRAGESLAWRVPEEQQAHREDPWALWHLRGRWRKRTLQKLLEGGGCQGQSGQGLLILETAGAGLLPL
jgi:hypothetical protein